VASTSANTSAGIDQRPDPITREVFPAASDDAMTALSVESEGAESAAKIPATSPNDSAEVKERNGPETSLTEPST
jgi:hypothetical protein